MKRHSGKRMYIWFMAGVILFSITLFWICYQFDNKYTAGGPQADNGLLTLDAATLHDYPVIFLTHGWEIHRGGLLTPEDFAENRRPDEIVYIGQYGGFEGNNPYGNPYGRATYRLNIVIPPEPAAYTLELPEIYSAYRLFINGVQAEQFGNPGPEHYYPQTGNATISFLAQNRVEIIVAAADYSHMYSGMVYPPAFGSPHEVSGMIQTRLTIRAAVCSVAAALALFFLFVGFFMKKDRAMLLFGAICLCFAGYVCYPIVKTIFRGGMGWYGFENFCFCAMLLLVILLQRTISGDKSRLSNLF
ncbi:MAG: ATP-binding protein, partial [Oscillospiraceae bacterium]|nr:ATP-binding protein [Oscillospiraceae bacterium]